MFENVPPGPLPAIVIALFCAFLVTAVWMYLVMRRTRAARIQISAFGVAVAVDMSRDVAGPSDPSAPVTSS